MNGEMIFFLCIIGLITLFGLYAVGVGLWYNYHNKKFVKNHPDYIEFQNKVWKKGEENCVRRKLIEEKKKVIDEVLAEMPYLTEYNRKIAEQQLAIYRIELAEMREDARPHFLEHIEMRDRLNKWHDELVKAGELKEF